jgi:hypothetical protein
MTDQVSRPVQILLGVTVLIALLWFVALRPKTASPTATSSTPTTATGPTAPGVKGLTDDVAKAHGAAGASAGNATRTDGGVAQAGGGATATTPGAATGMGAAVTTAPSSPASPVRPVPPTSAARVRGRDQAARALAQHRVLAALFFNPRASDDRSVVRTLRTLRLPGSVTTVAIPLQRASDYPAVTARVAVTGSPTLVVFDRHGTARTLVGYASSTLMRQRVDDALATR